MIRLVLAAALATLVASVALACNSNAPPRGPEETCARACQAHATRCSPEACWRGCNLVLDRLAEHEGDHVIACVAAATTPCADRTWSHCATRVGPHADGGPPAPPPPSDDIPDDGD